MFASDSECTLKGPVAIDLFCSLIVILSVTEIPLCEVNPYSAKNLYFIQDKFCCIQDNAVFLIFLNYEHRMTLN